jgi:hypothetical protein
MKSKQSCCLKSHTKRETPCGFGNKSGSHPTVLCIYVTTGVNKYVLRHSLSARKELVLTEVLSNLQQIIEEINH